MFRIKVSIPSHDELPPKEGPMLGSTRVVAFIPTRDFQRSRAFYEGALGLRVVSEDSFALVLDAKGIVIRVTKVPEFNPQQFTILGWEVPDIEKYVSGLGEKGVAFERYGFPSQDERGIWSAPGGAKVAWFKDPDGNTLSLTQYN
jgi:catechol 2,3-dioxygenase-like lactoylglutathione lyase family enzyme